MVQHDPNKHRDGIEVTDENFHNIAPGIMLKRPSIRRTGEFHVGICTGDGYVCYVGRTHKGAKKIIKRTTLAEFRKGQPVYGFQCESHFTPKQTAERAESCVGKEWIFLHYFDDCMSFVTWCHTSKNKVIGSLVATVGVTTLAVLAYKGLGLSAYIDAILLCVKHDLI